MRAITAPPLVLEPQLATHAAEMFALLRDPAIYEFENDAPPSEEWLRSRYEWLELRQSPDGLESWLNWVIRLPSGLLAGYVQATVLRSGAAYIAYELGSRYWRQGVATSSIAAVLEELREGHAVNLYVAVLKAANHRSLGLLRKLGFGPASTAQFTEFGGEPDELVMVKPA